MDQAEIAEALKGFEQHLPNTLWKANPGLTLGAKVVQGTNAEWNRILIAKFDFAGMITYEGSATRRDNLIVKLPQDHARLAFEAATKKLSM